MMPMFALLWALITYLEFFSPEQGEFGLFGYIVMSLVFLGVATMMWLMSGGKLPAYILTEDEKVLHDLIFFESYECDTHHDQEDGCCDVEGLAHGVDVGDPSNEGADYGEA